MTDSRPRHDIPEDTYVDTVAVERACEGDRSVSLNRAEVAAAVAHLHGKGTFNFLQIARLLGLSDRTVFRIVHKETASPQSRPGRGVAS
jgi:hypothetical protein